MKVEQIYEFVNEATEGILGEDIVLQQDLSNIVDVGEAVVGTNNLDNYVKALVNHIGRVKFVDRVYKGNAPSILMESWEFGSILEKIQAELPDAEENESWNLTDGQSYDPNVYHQPKVSAKFFNSKVTFEITMSYTEMQVKESFSSATQLNAFLSMLQNEVDKSLTIKTDALIKTTIAAGIAETLEVEEDNARAINLAQEYFNATGKEVAIDDIKTDPEFTRFAVLRMREVKSRLAQASRVYNIGGKVRFTSDSHLHVVLLDEFKAAADVYLYADLFNKEMAALPNAETVPFWQGSGTNFGIDSTSYINVLTNSGNEVIQSGILGVMFDREALGVTNYDRRVRTHYNPKAEFYNNFYKQDAGYFIDMDENFVVFYIGEVTEPVEA